MLLVRLTGCCCVLVAKLTVREVLVVEGVAGPGSPGRSRRRRTVVAAVHRLDCPRAKRLPVGDATSAVAIAVAVAVQRVGGDIVHGITNSLTTRPNPGADNWLRPRV